MVLEYYQWCLKHTGGKGASSNRNSVSLVCLKYTEGKEVFFNRNLNYALKTYPNPLYVVAITVIAKYGLITGHGLGHIERQRRTT